MTETASTTVPSTAYTTTLATPDGPFTAVVADDDVVLASGWTDDPDYLNALIHRAIRPATIRPSTAPSPVREAVEAYYSGTLTAIDDIRVRQRSGAFLEHAWDVLRTVPAGTPVTYTAFAELAGNAPAIRAAASACARNAAALFVPCHRVLRTDGSLGGFRYGLPVKESLLGREAAAAS